MYKIILRWAACSPLLLAVPDPVSAAPVADIADMSIEELANIQITSVSRRPERLAAAAASVYVITAEDIRRSGAPNLAEVLRLAPNLQVAQRSGYDYSMSARGLNGSNNTVPNKLLVLIDGRSVYVPMFSGVAWDVQEVMLEDIERIEVISGPGGTLWGVNAVQGVINITTRAAGDTAGTLLSLRSGGAGTRTAVRHGAGDSDGGWRLYASYLDQDHTELYNGARNNDARHHAQVGFRGDWGSGGERFTVNGNAYRGGAEQPEPGAVAVQGSGLKLGGVTTSGANLTGSWTHATDSGGSLMLQAYFDRTDRTVVPTYAQKLDIVDVQLQHSLARQGMHELVWGANYRYTWDDITNGPILRFIPAKVNQTWISLFAQDEMTLGPELRLTLGARAERNPYSGVEFLPTARVAWQAAPQHALWAGASRTVRAPARIDADAFTPAKPPYVLNGGPGIRSESAKVAELGYRGQPLPNLSYSVTVFHNWYDHLRTQEVLSLRPPYVIFANGMKGKAHGIEMWGSYQPTPHWRLRAGLTGLHQEFVLRPGSNDSNGPRSAGRDPSHTAQLRSSFALGEDQDLDVGLRRVGALRMTSPLAGSQSEVKSYTALDARYAWRLRRDMELSVAGLNLNGSHAEYGPLASRIEVGRQVQVKLVWRN